MLAPIFTSWRQQYDRLIRDYEKLQRPYQSSVVYDDDVARFFVDCWHLKDWIAADPGSGVNKRTIETSVNRRSPLRIAADLANASKHCDRNQHREGAYVTSSSARVNLGTKILEDRPCVVTLSDGTSRDLKTVIDSAFDAWRSVLIETGLISQLAPTTGVSDV